MRIFNRRIPVSTSVKQRQHHVSRKKKGRFSRRIYDLLTMSKLYVGNVPEGAKEKDLRELFEAFGDVEEVAMLRGYGFVVSRPVL